MRMFKNIKRRHYVLLVWIVFLCLCVVQIWEITNFDIIITSKNQPGEQLQIHNSNEPFANFISYTPARDYSFYHYNVARSDEIGAYRPLPDTRGLSCIQHSIFKPKYNCNVSVIIVFHNEARSTLLRTIVSIYKRTSIKYLHELIIIDDYSEDESLLAALATLNFPPFNLNKNNNSNDSAVGGRSDSSSGFVVKPTIKMQRNSYRLGLIESRNHGARLATGDYLFFLDSHCEVNVGWLEPLLERLDNAIAHRKIVAVSPVLDSINAEQLTYRAGSKNLLGGFDWNLHFHWVPRKLQQQYNTSSADAFVSPTFAGGVFMISRNWFFKLHGFNALLEIWGGESIEFSIKHWLCGGQIEIVPCSRIGHIFRKQHSFKFPHDDGDGQASYLRNSKIIAESWLDNYKYFFYTLKPAAKDIAVNISVQDLQLFKNNLNCRSFAWYLQNVFRSLRLPSDEFAAYGTLSSDQQCLHIMDKASSTFNNVDNRAYSQLLMTNCYNNDVTKWFLHRHNAHLHSSNGICLSVLQLSNNTKVQQQAIRRDRRQHKQQQYDTQNAFAIGKSHLVLILEYCDSAVASQRWLRHGPQLINEHTHLCLDNPLGDIVTISRCRYAAPSQYFRFSVEMQKL